jgi:hypothetical protein
MAKFICEGWKPVTLEQTRSLDFNRCRLVVAGGSDDREQNRCRKKSCRNRAAHPARNPHNRGPRAGR